MRERLGLAYQRLFLGRPVMALLLLLGVLAFFAYHAKDFRLGASADSLVLEGDPDLALFREVASRYQTSDLLIVAFTPNEPLFSDAALAQLSLLRDELREVESIAEVTTLLDVPLVKSSDASLLEMVDDVPTLESPSVDRERAIDELSTSPVFRDLVLSRDLETTALLLSLHGDTQLTELFEERNALRAARRDGSLSPEARKRLTEVETAHRAARDAFDRWRHRDIARVRSILERHREHGVLHLGGVPMIADDMITFVRNDLLIFGSAVLFFIVVVLTVIFRQPRWVLLPLLSCFYAGTVMTGVLGLIGWEVTVISSNFLSLMLIITISINIHLVVRYQQLFAEGPDLSNFELVATTLRKMLWPCLYTSLTTIIGFCSLVLSDIKPVIDFGWMMSAGLGVAFLTSFSLFPAVLMLAGKPASASAPAREFQFTVRLARIAERHGNTVLLIAVAVAVASAFGISRLTVENSFIDYFSSDTEIYQGMALIDEKLGGTTPLQVLLNLDPDRHLTDEDLLADDDFEDEDFEEWDTESGPEYWFTPFKVDQIKRVHDYLDGLPEVGKVLSIASAIRVAENMNDGKEFDGIELSVLYRSLPDEVKVPLVDPYFSFENDEARILLRILDSMPGLRRGELLARIRSDLEHELDLGEGDVTLTGTMILYNNMLQSLYASQISSLGAVTFGIALMLLVLFRSLRLMVIGIVPNLLAAGSILGLMGLVGIPLDLMTITIAAIAIGIAVDNSIHYIYRFREEFEQSGDYTETLYTCHGSIGRAVLYTSSTIIFGFSVLVLSNFFPTIYFGALTGLAMLVALLAALTLLPRLILITRPFGEPSPGTSNG